jgi:dual-specificity kinase
MTSQFDFIESGINYYCMVFETLNISLYDVIKLNDYRGMILTIGFSLSQIQAFSLQLLHSLQFIHSISLTHTDLKPENILLVDNYTLNKG